MPRYVFDAIAFREHRADFDMLRIFDDYDFDRAFPMTLGYGDFAHALPIAWIEHF
jgi:hypothetical protein